MSEPRDPLDVEPWPPKALGKFYVGFQGFVRGPLAATRLEAREEGVEALLDFGSAPRRKLRWSLLRWRYRAEREAYQGRLDRWYVQARREAGLPRVPTRTDLERHRGSLERDGPRLGAYSDPEVQAAVRRLREIWEQIPLEAKWFDVQSDGTIIVRLRPYTEAIAERIRLVCHPAQVRFERDPSDG
jgi:hypothetical protein